MGRSNGMSLLSLTYGSDGLYVPNSREQEFQFTCIRVYDVVRISFNP